MKSRQHKAPDEGVLGNRLNPKDIDPELLDKAKALVEKAVKQRKIFSIHGPYPVIRAALRARGWVEQRPPGTGQQRSEEKDDGEDSGNENEGDEQDKAKPEDPHDIHWLMSQMVQNETPSFYWSNRIHKDLNNLKKNQMTNLYAKHGALTTKVGLCANLRNLHCFDAADPNTFFPRCYRLEAEDDRLDFIDDFRRTSCTSLLQHIVEKSQKGGKQVAPSFPNQQGRKRQIKPLVSSRIISTALEVCQAYLDNLEHNDIDVALDSAPKLTDQQWSQFLHNYYLAVHDGVEIENCNRYVGSCQAMLHRLREVHPQLDIDGTHSIWIAKPGAKSCGRGIICKRSLGEILKLVTGNPKRSKSNNWVVQKYIERPFLVHGTKIDLRQWFLVTNWNPLTVWFYKKCYLRFSTQPYSLDKLEKSVHLCNNSFQKDLQPSPLRHPEIPGDSMWCCHQFCDFLASQGKADQWQSTVIPEMKKALVRALQTVQGEVEPRPRTFELFGADFLLGEDLHPWLLEINASPSTAPTTALKARLCPAVQEDTLRVVLDRKLDKSASTGDFELIYNQAIVKLPKYKGVDLIIQGAAINQPYPPLRTPVNKTEPCLTSMPDTVTQLGKEGAGTALKPRPSSMLTNRTTVREVSPRNRYWAPDCSVVPESCWSQSDSLTAGEPRQICQVPVTPSQPHSGKRRETAAFQPRPPSTPCMKTTVRRVTIQNSKPASDCSIVAESCRSQSDRLAVREPRQICQVPVTPSQPHSGKRRETAAFQPRPPSTPCLKMTVEKLTIQNSKAVFGSGSWRPQDSIPGPWKPQDSILAAGSVRRPPVCKNTGLTSRSVHHLSSIRCPKPEMKPTPPRCMGQDSGVHLSSRSRNYHHRAEKIASGGRIRLFGIRQE